MHAGIKSVSDARVGDTLVRRGDDEVPALSGYKEPVPVVYCGLFPVDTTQYNALREALQKLQLNDAALAFEPETSSAMGFGFRCGFLGLLHMEIVQERLEREYDLDLIVTAPSVVYEVTMSDGSEILVDAPGKLADGAEREEVMRARAPLRQPPVPATPPHPIHPTPPPTQVREPYVSLEIFCPKEYSGTLMELAQSRRGEYADMKFLTEKRVSIR